MNQPTPPSLPDAELANDLAAIRAPSPDAKAVLAALATFLPLNAFFGFLAVFPAMAVWAGMKIYFHVRARRTA